MWLIATQSLLLCSSQFPANTLLFIRVFGLATVGRPWPHCTVGHSLVPCTLGHSLVPGKRGWVTDGNMWLFLSVCKPLMGIFKTQGLQVRFHTHDPSGYGVMLACFMLTEQISCLFIVKSVLVL